MNEKQEKISEMILNYLRKNPEAGDTLEGIVSWWMCFESIESSIEDVSNVLETLIAKGEIHINYNIDGARFYKVCNKVDF